MKYVHVLKKEIKKVQLTSRDRYIKLVKSNVLKPHLSQIKKKEKKKN